MAPQMLERAVAAGEAPTLAALMARGTYAPDCVAAFPSVTPVCAASIVTGAWQDEHEVPGMCWYHRDEGRYVEYGSSFRASQRVGVARQLMDTVYNMNGAHLAREPATVFEALDDCGVRTAGTTYLMYRGRHRHEPKRDTAMTRIAAALFRHPVLGPKELFYADIFASRATACRAGLGMPGIRDQHSGCVGAELVREDLFDFLLLSFPDNDWHSHRSGPEGQLRGIALADVQLARVLDAAGGIDRFLEDYALIVMADHSQAPVAATIALQEGLAELGVLAPTARWFQARAARERPRIALCPSQRAAMAYVLDEDEREALTPELALCALQADGVELALWLRRDVHGAPAEAAIARAGRDGGGHEELRFKPGGEVDDEGGRRWSVEGALEVLGAQLRDGRLHAPDFPDALARAWAALTCPTSGDVLLSAAPEREFVDIGGAAHVGGGSHGSLRAEDSLGALIVCGIEGPLPERWSIADVAPLIRAHFGA